MALNNLQLNELKKIQDDHANLQDLSEELRENEEFMYEVIKLTVDAWDYVSPSLKSNKNFILSAINTIHSNAFRYGASESLRDDEDVVLAATKKNSTLFFLASDRLKSNEDFKNKALKKNS